MNQHQRNDDIFNWPTPTAKQHEFIHSKAKYPELCGGWGAAKTWALCMRAILQGINSDVFGNLCGNRIIVGRWTAKELKDTTLKDFMQLLPKKWLSGREFGLNRQDMVIKIPGGTEYVLAHFENFTIGGNYSAIFIDQSEELDVDTWDMLPGRIRMMNTLRGEPIPEFCRCICTTRNPNGHSWQYKKWELNRLAGERGSGRYDERYHSIPCTTHDNAENLPPDYIPNLERSLSPKKYRIFVGGSHEAFEGQIYDEWNYDGCVNEINEIPASSWPKYVGIDHGYPAAKVAIFCAVKPNKDVLCYDEVVMEDTQLSAFVERVLAKMQLHQREMAENEGWEPRGLEDIWLWPHDPSMGRRTDDDASLTISSLYLQEFRRQTSGRYTPAFHKANNSIDAGNDKVNWLFWNNEAGRDGLPKETVNPRCGKCIESFETYHYNPKTERPMQEDSGYYIDVCDAHRYIISTIFQGDFMMVPKQKRQRTHVDDVMDQIRNAQSMEDINHVAHDNGWVTHGHR
jgi:hypothetical protein